MKKINDINIKQKPLSPHLGIYKWQINSITSILHRITGVGLYFILLAFFWLFSLNVFYEDNEALELINNFLKNNIFGRIFLSLMSFVFYYHALNGIKYLFFDLGFGFDLKSIQIISITILIFSILMSSMTFVFINF